MRLKYKLIVPALLFLISRQPIDACAKDPASFTGEVNANAINIRSNSTINSEVICIVNKGEALLVSLEFYGWYKVGLPKKAPAYIKKNLVTLLLSDERNKTAKVLKEKVNIRIKPSDSSPIIGRVNKDELINILEDRGEWFKIGPPENSFGWINKKFINLRK